MKDIVIVTIILVYYIALGLTLSTIFADSSFQEISLAGNQSFDIGINTSERNINISEVSVVDLATGNPIINALGVMFGFRTPTYAGFPSLLSQIVSLFNWLIFIIGAVVVWKIIRSGAG